MNFVTLMSGRVIPAKDITFNRDTYHFFYGGADITGLIYRRDKLALVPDFDVVRENERIYAEGNPGAPATGSTSVWDAFWGQIVTDPLAAPLEYADTAVSSTVRSTTGKLLLAGLVIGGLYYFRHDLKKFLS